MNKQKVLVGKTERYLVIRYDNHRVMYPIEENPHKTAHYLKLTFPSTDLDFESIIELDGLKPVEPERLERLVEAWNCLK